MVNCFNFSRQGGGTGELFADIFGSSDEDEEFEVSTDTHRALYL